MIRVPPPDVRPGDVWVSAKGNRKAKVESVKEECVDIPRRMATVVRAKGVTGAAITAEIHNFVKGRTLAERGGKAVP